MFERAEKWCIHSGPGHWPDADMLPVGALRQNTDPSYWTKFTHAELRTMMTLWCMMRSPLMIGGEMTKFDDFSLKLLTNAPLLEIEKATHCAHPLYTTDAASAWIAPRVDGQGVYAALFNLSDKAQTLEISADELGLPAIAEAAELWSGKKGKKIKAKLAAHDAAVWLVKY